MNHLTVNRVVVKAENNKKLLKEGVFLQHKIHLSYSIPIAVETECCERRISYTMRARGKIMNNIIELRWTEG